MIRSVCSKGVFQHVRHSGIPASCPEAIGGERGCELSSTEPDDRNLLQLGLEMTRFLYAEEKICYGGSYCECEIPHDDPQSSEPTRPGELPYGAMALQDSQKGRKLKLVLGSCMARQRASTSCTLRPILGVSCLAGPCTWTASTWSRQGPLARLCGLGYQVSSCAVNVGC
eukprot:765552-Hanusia_phi.AAC.2